MVIPTYSDLGKSTRDLFSKGFIHGNIKLNLKSNTDSGFTFTTGGTSQLDSGKLDGSFETKYTHKGFNVNISERWAFDNNMYSEVSVEDKLIQGLKLEFDSVMSAQTGKWSGKLKTSLAREFVNMTGDIDVDFHGPLLNGEIAGSVVIGHGPWALGTQAAYNVAGSKLSKLNFALGHTSKDFDAHLFLTEGSNFSGSLLQKILPSTQVGLQCAWSKGSRDTTFGIAAKHVIDASTTLSTKLNNALELGLGLVVGLRPGVNLTVSTICTMKNDFGHQVGLGLELEP